MANDDLKKIKELLEIVHNKVGKLETHFMARSSTLDLIKGQQSVMNDKLDDLGEALGDVQKTQTSHTGSLIKIESTLEGYADAYKINKGNIERLDERVFKVEDQLDIRVSPEFTIQR